MSSPIGSKFFIEPPDEYWNTGHPKQIIEAEEQPADKWGGVSLKVLAPESFASKWPSVSKQLFIECSGPVRTFDYRGYVQFIHSIRPNIPLPKGWKEEEKEKVEKS
jgi:hypothetical protein